MTLVSRPDIATRLRLDVQLIIARPAAALECLHVVVNLTWNLHAAELSYVYSLLLTHAGHTPQVHGPDVTSVAVYEKQCADAKQAKAAATAARKQQAADRKALKLAKQQATPPPAPYPYAVAKRSLSTNPDQRMVLLLWAAVQSPM